MEKLIYGLAVALIGGIFFLAYNNPKGYEAFISKLAKWLTSTWETVCFFGAGIHFTFWQFDLPIKDNSFYSYLLPNFAYVWGSALIFLFLYLTFNSLGRLLGDLKNQDGEKNS